MCEKRGDLVELGWVDVRAFDEVLEEFFGGADHLDADDCAFEKSVEVEDFVGDVDEDRGGDGVVGRVVFAEVVD